jgi:hypothetical protein
MLSDAGEQKLAGRLEDIIQQLELSLVENINRTWISNSWSKMTAPPPRYN